MRELDFSALNGERVDFGKYEQTIKPNIRQMKQNPVAEAVVIERIWEQIKDKAKNDYLYISDMDNGAIEIQIGKPDKEIQGIENTLNRLRKDETKLDKNSVEIKLQIKENEVLLHQHVQQKKERLSFRVNKARKAYLKK